MKKEFKGGISIDALLDKDSITSLFAEMLEQYEDSRFCLVLVLSDKGDVTIKDEGSLSALEYVGISRLLNEFCEARIEQMREDE